jgi:hypothetical protein
MKYESSMEIKSILHSQIRKRKVETNHIIIKKGISEFHTGAHVKNQHCYQSKMLA